MLSVFLSLWEDLMDLCEVPVPYVVLVVCAVKGNRV